jgi:hypothetical protein
MPCNVIDARLEPCKEYVGGIQGIFLIPFVWSDVIELQTVGQIGTVKTIKTSSAVLVTGYFWELKGSSSFDVAMTSSRDNGTTMYDQNLTVVFKPKSLTTPIYDFNDYNTLAKGRWRIVVWDRNDNFWLVGEEYGADATTGVENFGTALGDPRNYSVTFVASESNPPRPLDSTTYAGLSTIFTPDSTPT